MRDAEALLLIHDDKAKVLEFRLFRQDRMRSDNDIDLSVLEPLARFLQFASRHQSGQSAHLERETVEARREILEVLTG